MVATLDAFDLRDLPPEELSAAERLALLDDSDRVEIIGRLTDAQVEALAFDWDFWGRPDQRPPAEWETGDAVVWAVRAGRGYGKTRTGAETVRHRVETGKSGRLAIVAPTAGDARDVMVEGESGILAVHPNASRPHYEPSKRRITWANGATATVFSADEPERLRGPQHDFVWGDEPASWRFGDDAWANIELGLRLGDPKALLTGTPKPLPWLREVWDDPQTVVTTGASYRNLGNLAPAFIARILRRYEGTRLGLQEIHALVLEDVEGALWRRADLDRGRLRWADDVPDLDRIVIGVDPAVTSGPNSDETGIVAAGRHGSRDRGQGYVLGDHSLRGTPHEWGTAVVEAYRYHDADRVIAEKNNGGEMVRSTIHSVDPNVPVDLVSASRGKATRAEPIAALYEVEPARVHHVGTFADLETQQCEWVPGEGNSPDRVDALVWALTDLLGPSGRRKVRVVT